MPYGSLSPRQREALGKLVRGQVVHDLGAGDLGYSRELLALGARSVIAIDKEQGPSKNTDGSACGTLGVFLHLVTRPVLVYLPERENTLIGYGPGTDTERGLRGEEAAALSMYGPNPDEPWPYEVAEKV